MRADRVPVEFIGPRQPRVFALRAMQVGNATDETGARCVTLAWSDWNGDAHAVALLPPDARSTAAAILGMLALVEGNSEALEPRPALPPTRASRRRRSKPDPEAVR